MKKYLFLFVVTVVMSFLLGVMFNSVKDDLLCGAMTAMATDNTGFHPPEKMELKPDNYKWVVNPPQKAHSEAGVIGTYENNYKNPCWYVGPPSAKNLRCMPYFYSLGVGKSGSSTLYLCLNKHPDIALARRKELGYWDFGQKSLPQIAEHYTKDFETATQEIYNSTIMWAGFSDYHNKITYDGTPRNVWYLWLPDQLLKIYKRTRLIIIMRNPTERLHSHYHHECVRLGLKCSPELFHAAVQREISIFLECQKKYTVPQCVQRQPAGHANLKYSVYFGYVKVWLDKFPSSQILFIKAEEFYQNVTKVMDGVFRFLQLEPVNDDINRELEEMMKVQAPPGTAVLIDKTPFLKKMQNTVTGLAFRERAKEKWNEYHKTILPKTKKLLDGFYAPYNKMLADLLEDDRFLFQDET